MQEKKTLRLEQCLDVIGLDGDMDLWKRLFFLEAIISFYDLLDHMLVMVTATIVVSKKLC